MLLMLRLAIRKVFLLCRGSASCILRSLYAVRFLNRLFSYLEYFLLFSAFQIRKQKLYS